MDELAPNVMNFDKESLKNLQNTVESFASWTLDWSWQFLLCTYTMCQDAVSVMEEKYSTAYTYAYKMCCDLMLYLWLWSVKTYQSLMERYPGPWTLKPIYWTVLIAGFLSFAITVANMKREKSEMKKKDKEVKMEKKDKDPEIPCRLSIYDLAKTAYEPGRVDVVIDLLKKLKSDVNNPLPENGLTLFLCACISAEHRLVDYMIKRAKADVTLSTSAGDSPLYLATYGVLGLNKDKFDVLETLIKAGCDVNHQNKAGFTCLHRAANRGNIPLIKFLLDNGADPYIANKAGIYPIDSAISASHVEAANLLIINLKNSNVWDIVEPHTPTRVELGLQSPRRKHLIESTRRNVSGFKK